MPRNYMRVIVANESNATLRLRHFWTSGDWTSRDWQPSQFPETPSGGSLYWQAEGESIVGLVNLGVEARAWYEVIGPTGAVAGELYIHANCPFIESQYGNTFHVHSPGRYYATYVDSNGQKRGNRSILEISFRNTRRVQVPGFTPTINGFQFSNSWNAALPVVTLGSIWNRFRNAMTGNTADVLGIGAESEDWMPITQADAGLCGGMVYTIMDYFNARQLPPEPARSATNPGIAIAPDSPSDPLFQHIRQRLLDSFDFTGRGHRWLSYSSPVYPDDDEGILQTAGLMKGKSWITYREEWPHIRELLDLGQLVPIGLVQTSEFDIGANHQVLAYAYQQDGQVVQLWIYDPNVPKQADLPALADDVYLDFDISNTSDGITVTRHNARTIDYKKKIYAIIHMGNYAPQMAPFGRTIPSPARPKKVELVSSKSEIVTTGGTATRETTGHCGNIMRFGHWTSRTTVTFVTQIFGFLDPIVKWKLDGEALDTSVTSINIIRNGLTFHVGCQFGMGGRSLVLSSGSGDTYQLQIAVDVMDTTGSPVHAEIAFEVAGEYEGLQFEDLRAETQCIAANIPVPIDLGIFTVPGPEPDPGWDVQEWKRDVLETLRVDPSVNPGSLAAIESYIDLQVDTPEFRPLALDIATRLRGYKKIL